MSVATQLSLQQVAKKFVEQSEVLKSLRAEIDAARYDEKEASRALLPSISLVNSVVHQKVPAAMFGGFDIIPDKTYTSALNFNQPLYMGGKIWQAWNLRQEAIKGAELNYRQQEQQLVTAVAMKAVNLSVALKIKEVLEESQKIQKQFWDIVRLRAQRGASKDFEVAQAEGDYYAYVGKLHQQESIIENFRLSLIEDLGLKTTESLIVNLPLPEKNVKEATTTEERPEVLLAKQQVVLAEINKKLAMGDHFPSVHIEGQWGYQAIETSRLWEADSRQHNIALRLNIPLFSGLSSLAVRRASENRITAAKMQLKHIQDQAAMEVTNAQHKLQMAKQVVLANKTWLQQAQKAVKKGLSSYKLGVISTFQMVQLQKGYEGAALSFWNSLMNYYSERFNGLIMKGQRLVDKI